MVDCRSVVFVFCLLVAGLSTHAQSMTGWNTWDASSQLDYVRLPEGFSLNLALKDNQTGELLIDPLLNKKEAHIELGPHSTDGSYTCQTIRWAQRSFRFESATDSGRLVLLVTPLDSGDRYPVSLVALAGIRWQIKGNMTRTEDRITWRSGAANTTLYATAPELKDPYIVASSFYQAFRLNHTVGLSVGRTYTENQVRAVLDHNKKRLAVEKDAHGKFAVLYDIIQSAIAWNTLYDPAHRQVATPVSRGWCNDHGGYVLFEWDNYFVSYMASLIDKDLSYANAVAITNTSKETGFVPNMIDVQMMTRDRSEPPVGALCVREIYRRYREKAFLQKVYDGLLTWNDWWAVHRDINGLLAWGSDAYQPHAGNYWETAESGVNQWQGASYESGMDNAPMYMNVPFDSVGGKLLLWDIGLNSLYIQDCRALADIAGELGKTDDAIRLRHRAEGYEHNLEKLWDDRRGIYCNRRSDNGEFSAKISPTSFYVLLTNAPDSQRVARMLRDHFYNPDEFYGRWMLPTVPRNDTFFRHQDYWQGRIWGPVNFLVYLGLRNHHCRKAAADLAQNSLELLSKNWNEHHFVCENYNAITGEGGEQGVSSDPFYHWGALLGLPAMMEAGVLPVPTRP